MEVIMGTPLYTIYTKTVERSIILITNTQGYSAYTPSAGPAKSYNNLPSFSIDDSLTEKDKALVVASTGDLHPVSASGLHEINQFAVRLAIDRNRGALSGEVDHAYLNNLISEEQQKATQTDMSGTLSQQSIPLTSLYKAIDFINETTVKKTSTEVDQMS
jgi:hypothetical protein